jgi:hypothetical protein
MPNRKDGSSYYSLLTKEGWRESAGVAHTETWRCERPPLFLRHPPLCKEDCFFCYLPGHSPQRNLPDGSNGFTTAAIKLRRDTNANRHQR